MTRSSKPLLLALLVLAAPAYAQRMDASADCAPTAVELVYDCKFVLTSGGAPVEGAAFTVKPDMPSMPMAHNLPSAPATPMDEPGAYAATLPLEMHGRWSLRLDLTEPRRDVVILDHDFEPADDAAMNHGGQGHGMSGGGMETRKP